MSTSIYLKLFVHVYTVGNQPI